MPGDCAYGLQIHCNTDNIVMFTGLLCKAGAAHSIENWVKRYYNSPTKTKNKWLTNFYINYLGD